MKPINATTLQQVYYFLESGTHKYVAIDFDISSDEFFSLTSYWCERGAKIKKDGNRFVIKMGKPIIPANS